MTTIEKTLLESLASAVNLMSEKEKWYLLGYAEAIADKKEEDKKCLKNEKSPTQRL